MKTKKIERDFEQKKSFIVDFGSWVIIAKNKADAKKQAEQMLKDGKFPCIDTITED